MSAELFLNLRWLPESPPDFAEKVRTASVTEDLVPRLRRLAGHALNVNQLVRLARAVEEARRAGTSLEPLSPFTLGVLSSSTVDFMVPAMIASALRHGINLTCIRSEFGQTLQEVTDGESAINRAQPDAVLLAIDYRGLPLACKTGHRESALAACTAGVAYLNSIREAIRRHTKAICILQTVVPPPEALSGSLDRRLPGSPQWLADCVNRALAESIEGSPDVLLDAASIAASVGTSEWQCPRQWNLGKFAVSESCIPLYADHIARVLGALRGKSRRCLILDLDNTLWGGVIGDDGMDGISLAQGDATGEAHLSLQRLALDLRQRGALLAVCSKNDDAVARQPFRAHPEMLLKEEHIAVFQANWSDKATNIAAIARELSLGLESMVFVDDNPAERGLVRELLPQVAVPEMPNDPAYYARTVAAAGYFEAVAFSSEDAQRADYYQLNARRAELQSRATGVEDYLASLNMGITFSPFDATGRARITQLINKSNQYNLTTRRYTEAEVAAAEADPDSFTLQVRLTDIFGDNGMISVVICRALPEQVWEIDTWLMSCRVLGRRVENMVLSEILEHALQREIRRLRGRYIPTERNGLVKDHFEKLGFKRVATAEGGASVWELAVDHTHLAPGPAVVSRIGFAAA